MSRKSSRNGRISKFTASVLALAFGITGNLVFQTPAQALTATVNSVSFKAPVFDSYNHGTGGGVWNDGSVTYDKGELLGTNYKCGDFATFMLELNTSANPTKQPAPYKAQISINYTWDSTGATGASLTALADPAHLKTNTGVIRNASGTIIGGATGTVPSGVAAGWDSGFNAAGISAAVATSPAPVVTNTGTEFGGNSSVSNVTFTVEGINAGANIVVRSDAVIHCKPNSSPTGNMQAALSAVTITYPGAPEIISAGNQTVNFRGVGNLAGLGAGLAITKAISSNGSSCTTTVATANYSSTANVLYCYTITNTGVSDASGVLVMDDNATPGATGDDVRLSLRSSVGGTALTDQTVIPAGTTVYAQMPRSSLTAGTYTNIATATSTNAPTVSASATVVVGSAPILSVVKTQTSSNPAQAGDVITYSIVITNNTGNSSNTTLYDANASSITCGPNTATAPAGTYGISAGVSVPLGNTAGSTYTCTVTHVVSTTEATAGTVSNQAYVWKPNANSSYSSNTVVTPITVRPLTYDISVFKTQTSTTRPSAAGQFITYQIQVTNVGTGTLTAVNLTDNLSNTALSGCVVAGTTTPVTLPIASFLPGASFTCVATHTVQPQEITDGTVTNYATASTTSTGVPSANLRSNDVVTPLGSTPSLKVIKMQASQGGASNTGQYPSAIGQTLNYAIAVTNDGNVALTGVVITDPNADSGSLTCSVTGATTSPGVALAVGATIDCTARHTVTAADLTAGSIENVATATGTDGSTNLNVNSTNIVTTAALRIVKSRTSITQATTGITTAGDTIAYNIVVTNTGSVTLTGIVVADANATNLSCPATSLAAGVSMTCTAVHVATITEASAGHAYNTATVRTTQITGAISSNEVETPLTAASIPHVSIVKARTSAAPTIEGDEVTYSITVTSDGVGNATVSAVTDANAAINSCTQGSTPVPFTRDAITGVATLTTPLVMAPNDSFVCSATSTITAANVIAGYKTNTAAVSASDGSNSLDATSNIVTDPLTFTAALGVVKSYIGAAPSAAGDVVTYQIVVTNTGTVALTNVTVADPLISNLSCPSTPTLQSGAFITCTGSYTVLASDVTAGQVVNTASATGTSPGNAQTVNGTSNTITLPLTAPTAPPAPSTPTPSLSVVKALAGNAPVKVGGTVSYSIKVTNTGNIALSDVNLTDANATLGTCSVTLPAILTVGASLTCTAAHLVTDADFKAGRIDNLAVASSATWSITTDSNVVTVPLTPEPKVAISKKVAGALPTAIGGYINYSIVVTNIGNVPLHDVTVTDDNATITSCSVANPVATLAAGASFTCNAKHQLTDADVLAGKIINIAGVATRENATASSSNGSGSGGSSNSTPGSVTVPSNQVLTVIRVQSARYRGAAVHRPNGGTITLGAAMLKNPNLKSLAFTGDIDNVANDQSLFLGMLVVIAGALGIRRRLLKK